MTDVTNLICRNADFRDMDKEYHLTNPGAGIQTPTFGLDEALFENRDHAALLLARELFVYAGSDAVVVAFSIDGVPVGYRLARALHLPMQLAWYSEVHHPADENQCIASVTPDDVIFHEGAFGIPSDYVSRQVNMARHTLIAHMEACRGNLPPLSFKDRTVILTSDRLESGDSLAAIIHGLRKQYPSRIILAIPVSTTRALNAIISQVDDIYVLATIDERQDLKSIYREFHSSTDQEVNQLVERANTSTKVV